jgi:hypothetical protein
MSNTQQWAVKTQVPEEIYTDRQEFIDYFYKEALEAIRRRTMSSVLLGQRRMGKTEIFKRVVNRLFFEQDHIDPNAIIPVYYAFPEEQVERWEFCTRYAENFLRWFVAFRLHKPEIISETAILRHDLPNFVRNNMEISGALDGILRILRGLREKEITLPEYTVLNLPREIADLHEITIAVFLDEFQNTHLPQHEFRVVGFMQEAVESLNCPHFVTGSAIGILKDILGQGALFGRFESRPIEALTDYYGAELALRAARYYGATVPELMAPVGSDRCGANPFYVSAVVRQAAKLNKLLADEQTLNEVLAIDVSSGFIWAELHDQVTRWIARINDYNITKWVLYLAVLEEEPRISPERIQRELKRQENIEVDLTTIRDVLVKLSRGDLLDYKEFGNWFGKIKDPILEEFLKVWGWIQVKEENAEQVRSETVQKYQQLQRKFTEYKGYLAEVFMIQILWNAQRKKLPGRYFHSSEDVHLPERFFYIAQRSKLGTGKHQEIDIYAAAGLDVWLAESKCWTDRKVGITVVQHLLEQAQQLREREGDDLRIRMWLFAHNGVTPEAEAMMQQHQILWSTRADLDALLNHLKLRTLPEI